MRCKSSFGKGISYGNQGSSCQTDFLLFFRPPRCAICIHTACKRPGPDVISGLFPPSPSLSRSRCQFLNFPSLLLSLLCFPFHHLFSPKPQASRLSFRESPKTLLAFASKPRGNVRTYNHPNLHFLTTFLLLNCIVQHNIQEDLFMRISYGIWERTPEATNIVTSQNTNNLSAAIQLNKQPLIEVLDHSK